ncbi:MAG: SAM-dependent methyltransferase [Candidatus Dormibacteraeota bacterium]|uniref:SAM-dependent methyltransferase n=1 Tax=Candidatus Aeolococcus gillhamiae TaxID=3127015 RepID=A0A934K2Q5_9BACT|nr:SAM-dependent methyltransferase [Candidatus Dormibacteraeota bacterium]
MRPELPARLRSVASLFPAGVPAVADVGAGHGMLCASLAWRGFACVIATELSAGPLRELSTNLQAWGVSERAEVVA